MNITSESIKSQIVKLKKQGFGDIFFSSVFSEFISFIVFVFIVRSFPKVDYGNYGIAYNIYGYINVFIGLGLCNGILQYCSEVRSDEQKKAIYLFASRLGTAFSVVLLLIMPVMSLIFLDGDPRYYFLIMSGWPVAVFLSNFNLIRLRIIRDNRHFMISNVVSSFVFIIAVIPLTKLLGISGYIFAFYLKYISTYILARIFVPSISKKEISEKLSKSFKFEVVKYSLVCCITNFVTQILMLVDVTCINIFLDDPTIVASYKAATQIPVALLFIPSSVITFIFPYLAENNKNHKWLKKTSKKLILGVFCLNFLVAVMVIILAPLIVRVLWGEKYDDAAPILQILAFNFLITGSFNTVFGNIMVAIKKVNINLIKTAICSSLNIVLNILLIKRFGSFGAAYATVIVSFCSSIFAVSYFIYWIRRQEKNDLRKEEANV